MNNKDIISEMIELASSDFLKNRIKAEFSPGSKNDIPLLDEEIEQYKWVSEVIGEQQEDGSWGRFHSMNSKLKRKWSTTESAMARLRYLGMKRTNISVQKACQYCERLINNVSLWPEYMEKNDLFPKAVPIYIATALSHFGSEDPLYRHMKESLLILLHEAFNDGKYNPKILNEKAKKYLGTEIHHTYIGLNSKYLIIFFHNNADCIDKHTQSRYLNWLHRQDTLFYSSRTLQNSITPLTNSSFICERVEFLSYLSSFHGFAEEYAQDLSALSHVRQSNGFWDLGNEFKCPRLSENWLKPNNRKIDQTFYIVRMFNNTHE